MRDIKLENLLLDSDDNIKLCDFGWAISENGDKEYLCLRAGSIAYMSPEILQGEL